MWDVLGFLRKFILDKVASYLLGDYELHDNKLGTHATLYYMYTKTWLMCTGWYT